MFVRRIDHRFPSPLAAHLPNTSQPRKPIAPGLELCVVSRRDLMIHADAQRFIAKRAGARAIEEIDVSPLGGCLTPHHLRARSKASQSPPSETSRFASRLR